MNKKREAAEVESEKMSPGLPRMKVWEEGDEVVVQVHISGVEERDIELEVKADFLKIDISKDFESKGEEGACIGQEWESSSFDGVVSLPCKVVPMLLHYSYDGKILEVRLKKAEE